MLIKELKQGAQRNAAKTLWPIKFQLNVKESLYKAFIRLAVTNDNKYWAVRKQYVHKISVIEMIMLKWSSRKQEN